jgi:chaperonin GroES
MKELQPINQQVLLDLSESKVKQTASGIIIPDTVEEKPMFAKVLSLSTIENSEINVGDTVLFKKYSGTEIEFEGRKYLLMPYADILAKIVETEEI